MASGRDARESMLNIKHLLKIIDMSQLGQEWLLNKALQNFQAQFHGPAPVSQTKSSD